MLITAVRLGILVDIFVGLALFTQWGNGEITWFDASLEDMLDPASNICQVKKRVTWSGHSEPINHLKRTARGNSLLSSSKDWEHVLWRKSYLGENIYLDRQSSINMYDDEKVLKTLILPNGKP
jgi:hypothetical protein